MTTPTAIRVPIACSLDAAVAGGARPTSGGPWWRRRSSSVEAGATAVRLVLRDSDVAPWRPRWPWLSARRSAAPSSTCRSTIEADRRTLVAAPCPRAPRRSLAGFVDSHRPDSGHDVKGAAPRRRRCRTRRWRRPRRRARSARPGPAAAARRRRGGRCRPRSTSAARRGHRSARSRRSRATCRAGRRSAPPGRARRACSR